MANTDVEMNKKSQLSSEVPPPFFIGLFTLLVVFRLWLITGVPKMLIYGPHDDLYFAKAAHYILHGQWMGPYTQMTLIKGPFYSFFLIFSSLTGLPLFFNETVFYVGACIILYFAFKPLIKNHWWRLLLFTLLLFCPASLATNWTLRVYREFVYFSLTLYVLAFFVGLFLRLDRKISTILFWSIGSGLSMGAFLITREEGVWIYPILFLLLIVCVVFIWKKRLDHKAWRSFLVLLTVFLWYIPTIFVSSLNYSYYGFWGTSEQLETDFNRVLNALGRIKTSTWHPAIQITKEARMKTYDVSPLLYEMKDEIENAVIGWNYSDDLAMEAKPSWYLSQYTNGGSEIGNGHFLWVFRDAVYQKGYYAEGKYPHEFYMELADQLESACNDGRLDCSARGKIPFVGSIDPRQYPIILRMFIENSFHLLNLDSIGIASLDIKTWPAWPENNNDYRYFEEFVYDSLDGRGIPSGRDAQYSLINGKTDLRLKILPFKEKIMGKISYIYNVFTLPVFVVGFLGWILLLVLSISRRQKDTHNLYLIISIFILGLLFSRLMTLTIMDATTSVPGFAYSASNYIFIYIFSFLTLYWLFLQCKMIFFQQAYE